MTFFKEKISLGLIFFVALSLIFRTPESPEAEDSSSLWDNTSLKQYCDEINLSESETETIHTVYRKFIGWNWDKDAAEGVIKVNILYFAGFDALEKDDLDDELAKFSRLGGISEVQDALVKYPELGTLLAVTVPIQKDAPERIIKTIPDSEEDKAVVYSLYVQYAAPGDACRIALLLEDSDVRDRIINLLKKSPVFVKYLDHFVFANKLSEEDSEAGEIYQEWLFELVDDIIKCPTKEYCDYEVSEFLSRSELPLDEFTRLNLTLEISSEQIRNNLSDREFRKNFGRYWSWHKEFLNSLDKSDPQYKWKWYVCASNPDIWKMFQYYGKETTFSLYRQYGEHAADILLLPVFLKPEPESQKLKDSFLAFMRTANEKEIKALVAANLPENAGYFDLSSRSTERDFIHNSLFQLAQAEQGEGKRTSEDLIKYWKGLSVEGLKDEILDGGDGFLEFLPGYDIWHVYRKWRDGRDVSGLEYVMAIVDAGFTVCDIASLGATKGATSGASTLFKEAVKTGEKSVLKYEETQTFKFISKAGTEEVFSEGAGAITKKTLEESGRGTLASFVCDSNRNLMRLCSKAKISDGADITDLSRYVYSQSHSCRNNLGSQTFKKTTELDARFFMDRGRRIITVVRSLPDTRTGKILGRIGKNMSEETAVNYCVYTVCSTEPVQEGIRAVLEKIKEQRTKATSKTMEAWRTNLSIWWLLSGESSNVSASQPIVY